jgi:hypothetical protein
MRELVFRPRPASQTEEILHPRVRCAAYCCAGLHRPILRIGIPLLTEVRADYDFVDRVLSMYAGHPDAAVDAPDRSTPGGRSDDRSAGFRVPGSLFTTVVDNDGDKLFSVRRSSACTRSTPVCSAARGHRA